MHHDEGVGHRGRRLPATARRVAALRGQGTRSRGHASRRRRQIGIASRQSELRQEIASTLAPRVVRCSGGRIPRGTGTADHLGHPGLVGRRNRRDRAPDPVPAEILQTSRTNSAADESAGSNAAGTTAGLVSGPEPVGSAPLVGRTVLAVTPAGAVGRPRPGVLRRGRGEIVSRNGLRLSRRAWGGHGVDPRRPHRRSDRPGRARRRQDGRPTGVRSCRRST